MVVNSEKWKIMDNSENISTGNDKKERKKGDFGRNAHEIFGGSCIF